MTISPDDWGALLLSLKLAIVSTFILLLITIPLSYWLTFRQTPLKIVASSIVTLPLILPPSVLGFYLLLILGPNGIIGKFCHAIGIDSFAFTFNGLIIASIIYSLPFVVQPIQNIFNNIGLAPLEVAATLRASPLDTFCNILLPQAKFGIIGAAILGFAHTIGEFGMVLMIGGNIPGKTQVAAIQIYNHVEAYEYSQANQLSVLLLVFSFIVLIIMYLINHKYNYLNYK